MHRTGFAIVVVLLGSLPAPAQTTPAAEATLSVMLRSYLLPFIPNPLYEKRENWGKTVEGVSRIRWEGQGLEVHPKAVKTQKKQGVWKHVKIASPNIAQALLLSVHNVQQPESGRTTFDLTIVLPAELEYEQQNWEKDIKLFSGSARARLRFSLNLSCELTTSLVPSKTWVPDLVIRVRVLRSTSAYDQLVVEHVPGLGGDAARILGDIIVKSMKQWHPSLERRLLEKLDAAIVKAGDSKEIHVGLAGISRSKPTGSK
jgi:hypothetical protein